ncbi:MAG: hypothetical protein AAF483_24980 [Planctomycetota bacterium]
MNEQAPAAEGNPEFMPFIRGAVGAFVGAGLGIALFNLAYQFGIMMLGVPGAAVGLLCGMLSGRKSILLGVLSGVVAFFTNAYISYSVLIQPYDFFQFVLHLHEFRTSALMVIVGTLFGFWFGIGRNK